MLFLTIHLVLEMKRLLPNQITQDTNSKEHIPFAGITWENCLFPTTATTVSIFCWHAIHPRAESRCTNMYLSSERLPLAAHHPKPSTNNTTSKPGGRGRSRTLKRYSKLFGAIAIHSLHTGPPSIYISIRSSICGMRLCKATDHLLTVRQ